MDQISEIEGVLASPLRVIQGDKGSIRHILRRDMPGFSGFGEAYFSTVHEGETKGWKCHREMVLNLAVPIGSIRFFLFDERDPQLNPKWSLIDLGSDNYLRLTVPPGVWMAFRGIGSKENWLINLASIPHDPDEADSLPLDSDKFAIVDL